MTGINSPPDVTKPIKVLHADLDYAAMQLRLDVVLAEVERWRQAYLTPDVTTADARLVFTPESSKEGQR